MMKQNKLMNVAMLVLLMLFSSWSYAQTIKVRGTVIDESKNPIVGVNVVILGTTVGTITDANGKYQLDADGKATLSFSFIGYETQNVAVNNQEEINISLSMGDMQLGDVIVVGYGTQRKEAVTGSVASVTGEVMRSTWYKYHNSPAGSGGRCGYGANFN